MKKFNHGYLLCSKIIARIAPLLAAIGGENKNGERLENPVASSTRTSFAFHLTPLIRKMEKPPFVPPISSPRRHSNLSIFEPEKAG